MASVLLRAEADAMNTGPLHAPRKPRDLFPLPFLRPRVDTYRPWARRAQRRCHARRIEMTEANYPIEALNSMYDCPARSAEKPSEFLAGASAVRLRLCAWWNRRFMTWAGPRLACQARERFGSSGRRAGTPTRTSIRWVRSPRMILATCLHIGACGAYVML